MNAGMVGADPVVLRRIATQFDDAALQLMGAKGSIQPWVDMTNIWRGLNYHMFKDMWDVTGVRTLIDTASLLQRYAEVLRSNAEAQEGASAADGAGGKVGSGLFSSRTEASGVGGGGGGGGGGWGGGGSGNRFDIDMSVPSIVHDFVANSIKTLKLGADAVAYVNHRQFAAAAVQGNMPLMNFHLMHQIDARNLSKFWAEAGDSIGHVGNVVTVLGSIGDFVSGSPSERLMAAVHMSTAGLSYLGPVGKGGAAIVGAFETIMPTTSEEQADVVAYGLNRMYPGADINNLTPEQANAIATRYDGVTGFGTMLIDTAGNHVENGGETVQKVGKTIHDAAGDAYSFLYERYSRS